MVEDGRTSLTPETPGERFNRLINQKVTHVLALQDNIRDPQGEAYTQAKEGLATVEDEFRTRCLHGNNLDPMLEAVFENRVADRLIAIHQDRRDRRRAEKLGEVIAERRQAIRGDWGILNKDFPNQYEEPDYEHQAQLGDVPPRSDAGGFEPRRRGW